MLIAAARSANVVEKDAPVLGAALTYRVDWFVTGDRRHFGHLFDRQVQGVLVLPLRAAVDRLDATLPPRSRRSLAK